MFFSTDLLSVKGGKFGTIWLLATTKDRNAVVKKKKAELLRTNMSQLCMELTRMFPVQGKEKSFSLRTSSILMYGICINLRVISEDLRRAVMQLLSQKPTISGGATGGGIDLPGGKVGNLQVTSLHVPTEADIDMGNLLAVPDMMEVDPDMFSRVDFRVRNSDITMHEPGRTGLDYEGPDLPILSAQDILTESWNLGNEGITDGDDNQERATRADHPVDIMSLPKRPRMEVDDAVTNEALKLPEDVAMEEMEVTRAGDKPIQEVGAPVRPRVPSDPVIGVTPAVDDERKRKRTQPVFLDMEAAAGNEDDKAVDVIPPPSPVPFIAMQPPSPVADIDYNQPPAIPVQEDPSSTSPSLDLQPLVPTPGLNEKRKTRRRVLTLVDMEVQIPSNTIKQGLQNYEDTMRCPIVALDFPPNPNVLSNSIDFKAPGRRLGGRLADDFKEAALCGPLGQLSWDWEKAVVNDHDQVQEQQEREGIEQGSVEGSGHGSRLELREMSVSGTFLGAPEAESSRISMDVEQGRKRQLESIVEEGVEIMPESPGNCNGGLNEKIIPEFNITDVPPVHGDIQDVQESLRQNIEVPTHQTSHDQDLDEMNQQAHIGQGNLFQEIPCPQDQDFEMPRDVPNSDLAPMSSNLVSQATVEDKLCTLVEAEGFCFFQDLCPPTTTKRREAAVTLFHLLQMEKEGKVVTTQEDSFSAIKVEKF